jgi:hypothetical protein
MSNRNGQDLYMDGLMPGKRIYRIRINQRVNRQLDQGVIETCMTKSTIVSRVLTWFWRQDSTLRNIIIGVLSPAEAQRVAANLFHSIEGRVQNRELRSMLRPVSQEEAANESNQA